MDHPFTAVDHALVGVLMGSTSDWEIMSKCSRTLTDLGIVHECNAISAHRHHERLAAYCRSAEQRGVRVFICAAGGAAHLAGVVAALTHLPVLACPMPGWSTGGLDALLSMAQMPRGVPVATFAIGSHGAVNAALFAASVLGLSDEAIGRAWREFRAHQSSDVQSLPPA